VFLVRLELWGSCVGGSQNATADSVVKVGELDSAVLPERQPRHHSNFSVLSAGQRRRQRGCLILRPQLDHMRRDQQRGQQIDWQSPPAFSVSSPVQRPFCGTTLNQQRHSHRTARRNSSSTAAGRLAWSHLVSSVRRARKPVQLSCRMSSGPGSATVFRRPGKPQPLRTRRTWLAFELSDKEGLDSEVSDQAVIEAVTADDADLTYRYLQRRPALVGILVPMDDKLLSPPHLACRLGRRNVLEIFLAAKIDINLETKTGESSRFFTSRRKTGTNMLLIYLLRLKPMSTFKSSKDALQSTLHHRMVTNGHLKVVNSLIKAQADVDIQDTEDCSPLYIAAHNDHPEVVHALVEAQANVDIQEMDKMTPLYIASENGHRKVVELLINAKANNGHRQIVDLLLIKAQADVNLQRNTGSSPLYIASQNNHLQVVALLIKAQARNGHIQVVDALIKAQADVNLQTRNGSTSLHISSQEGHLTVVKALIRAQADVNRSKNLGETPIKIASEAGHLNVVNMLIKAHADVNASGYAGSTPLDIASQNGHQEVVASLIKAQANVDLQRHTGVTPLYTASQRGHPQIVDMLIKAGADVNLQEKVQGPSPLYIASQNGCQTIVDSLIKAQADVNLREFDGCSPLYIASQNGHLPIVDSLIKAQADVNLQRSDGMSPLDIAFHTGRIQVANLLVSALADVHLRQSNGKWQIETATNAPKASDSIDMLFDLSLSEEEDETVPSLETDSESDCSTPPDDTELSRQLYLALSQAGFVNSRAALQSAAADVLQEILRKRLENEDQFVVGSFSEGWGNSLKTLDGRTDIASDIDVLSLTQGRMYHLKGISSNPAHAYSGATLRPAIDDVTAGRVCRYPPIAPIQTDRVSNSNIPLSILQALQNDINSASSPCHAVHAASPGRGGQELRVSTNFLEKRMQRCLTTLQGQLFVTLKYLVKKVICHSDAFNIQGLKPYHVKTITFRMLEETPVDQWKPENLVHLTRRSLQMLLDSVQNSRAPENIHGRIMEHFFLKDAALYLKGAVQRDGSMYQTLGDIANTLETVIHQLPQLLQQFSRALRPGISWPAEKSSTEASEEFVWRHLRSRDSAWKFCFYYEKQPEFRFLKGDLTDIFPVRLDNYAVYYYINFDALLWALRFELLADRDSSGQDWIRDVADREDADEQELRVAATYSACRWRRNLLLKRLAGSGSPSQQSVLKKQQVERKSRKRK
uniref:ANK_REP_REGION domain-containing protein n=1 Tax=Macrostomum lignano TaxID=282301 RepID=A0A1I8FSD0_9PLAT